MHPCPHCGSYNDGQATFCNQCGGRLTGVRAGTSGRLAGAGSRPRAAAPPSRPAGGRRGLIGSLLVAVLLVLLVGVILVTRRDEPDDPVARPAPAEVVEAPVESPPASDAPAPPVERAVEAPPEVEEGPSVAIDQKRVSTLVSRALVILELRDGEQRTTEQRGVLVDRSGVVLCRFEALIGARSGTARFFTREDVRADILGLSFRDEVADLALLRLAPMGEAFPAVPLASEDVHASLVEGEPLFVFNDYREIPALVRTRDYTAADGVPRVLLGESDAGPGLPPEVFLAVDPAARVVGLCRTEELAATGREPQPVERFRVSVDAAFALGESLHLPVGLTLDELTERLYAGTFPDLYERGRRAFRRQEWRAAIALFEAALERVGIDDAPDEQVEEVSGSLRESYLREVARLSKARRHREAIELAAAAVARFQEDSVLWRLLGEARLALDEHADGIAALLESRSLEPSRTVDETLRDAYLKVATDAMRSGDDRLAEVNLLEGIEALPSAASLYIELAKLYMRFEAYDDAVRLLEQARALDPTQAPTVESLLERIDDALKRRDAVIIPLTSSNSIRATVAVDDQLQLSFIIDTGATYTAIPESVAESLGYDIRRAEKVQVRTAGGNLHVPVIRMRSVSLGGYTVRNLRVLTLPDRIAPGVYLLGLNYLNHFKYTVDAQRREFRLERP